MCSVHILGHCNAHTKATHHRSWQQCYQQEFGFRIRSDSSYILAAEKQHTAILIPWCFQESKNSKIIKAKATKIISAVRFVKTLFTFESFQWNHSGNDRLLTLFRITYYNDKSSFDLTQFQEKTGSPNFCKVAYWNSKCRKTNFSFALVNKISPSVSKVIHFFHFLSPFFRVL